MSLGYSDRLKYDRENRLNSRSSKFSPLGQTVVWNLDHMFSKGLSALPVMELCCSLALVISITEVCQDDNTHQRETPQASILPCLSPELLRLESQGERALFHERGGKGGGGGFDL